MLIAPAGRGREPTPGFEALEPFEPQSQAAYDHVSPLEPPSHLDDRLDLEGEPDIDPDDIDLDAWADQADPDNP